MNVRLPKNNMGNMQEMIKKMQDDMVALQEDLESREYDISAGGGAVTVKINGKREFLAVDIDPEIVDPDDIETLSDILLAAFNEAVRRVDDTSNEEMAKLTGGMGLPGMGGFPGFPM